MNAKIITCLLMLAAAGCCTKKETAVIVTPPPVVTEPCDNCGAPKDQPMGTQLGQELPREAPEKGETIGFQPIHFDTNRADIKASERKKLDAIAAFLKQNGVEHVRVYGHCDERGTREYNNRLSRRRVNSVIMYLNHRLNKPDYEVYALGEDSPLCTEKTAKCWALNRRVEITAVLPK